MKKEENKKSSETLEKVDTSIVNEEVEDRRKDKKKRLLLLLLLLLITGIVLGSSTYAWFTANKTVAVNDIQVNVAAENGIQISVDGTSWKSIVQTTDINNAINTYAAAVNQVPSETSSLAPVSTTGNIDANGRMEMFLGEVKSDATTGDYILTSTKSEETNGTSGNFIAFDLFFKVDEDTTTYFTPNTRVVTTDVTDTGIKNATRMAFVVLGNTASGTALSEIQALNAGTSAEKKIYEPNYDVHTAAGVSAAYDYYGITTTEADGSLLPYSGVKTAFDETAKVSLKVSNAETHATKYTDKFDAVTVDYSTKAGFTENFEGLTLTAGITKVRVYMWVEGQDVDCENSASGGNITYGLQITTENTTQVTGD